MRTVEIIQARMGSTRLPGKMLRVLSNATVLAHVVQRAQRAPGIDGVVIATTELPQDDAIVEAGIALGVGVSRGSEDDVLSRYYRTSVRSGRAPACRRSITSRCWANT